MDEAAMGATTRGMERRRPRHRSWTCRPTRTRTGECARARSSKNVRRVLLKGSVSAMLTPCATSQGRAFAVVVCCVCGTDEADETNPIVMCDGCPWAYHQQCRNIPDDDGKTPSAWLAAQRAVGSRH